ncbi:ATP-binding protein [Clostridium bornimense]|uniref:AAA family ATPase n=1 Tax=Clostridium bornimense TaxID=1216932 RepID=UPI001C10EBC8|nr:AAA family ATPase [Clostridium bornimense]MBU5316910.1 ATP-binding protein [Clostridium bornimense]
MLTKIELENFKSFKNRTIIDLQSTNYKILNNSNVNENGILKGAIFVGGNATGKTNIILSLKLLLDLLFREKLINIGAFKCLFSQESNIKLSYEFIIDEEKIRYCIEYDTKEKSLIEILYVNDKEVLNRIGKSAKSNITENSIFEDLDNKTLILRTIYFNTKFSNYPILKKWFGFLINSIYMDASVRVRSNTYENLSLIDYLDKNGESEVNNFFDKYNFNQRIEYTEKSTGNMISIDTDGDKTIFFKRKGIDEPIPYVFESLGNKNLLNMLPSFFHIVKNSGMLIIDEFSSAFHNELEELLIKFFMTNSKNSQIFIVSHSTNLLSNSIFRPDQEYAVEFNDMYGSKLNRFSNDKPREAQNIEKMYNSGCFGGLPQYNL